MWLCLALTLFAVAGLVWLFGPTWWAILIAVVALVCPAILAWLLLGGLEQSQRPPDAGQ